MKGLEKNKKDDLLSLGNMLVKLLKGKLSNINRGSLKEFDKVINPLEQSFSQRTFNKKELNNNNNNLPKEFKEYFRYIKELRIEQNPDYNYLKNLFKCILLSKNKIIDYKYFSAKHINNNNNNINTNLIYKRNEEILLENINKPITPGIKLFNKMINIFCNNSKEKESNYYLDKSVEIKENNKVNNKEKDSEKNHKKKEIF